MFEKLDVPNQWEQYWTKYPHGYTILEALINWVSQVNDMVDNVNDWEAYLDDFKANIDDRLKPFVEDTLNQMESDGTLDQIINQEIFSDLNNDITTVKNSLGVRLGQRLAVETDDTGRFQRALSDLKALGGSRLYVAGQDTHYMVTTQLELFEGLMVSGNSKENTIIEYQGPAGTALFKDMSDKWGHGIIFEHISLFGDGTDRNSGTVDGVSIGDITDTTKLYNTPWVRFYDCYLNGFKTGIYLEGYGHTFMDTLVQNCDIGIQLVHPEQVYALNSWVQYCNVGIELNPEIKMYAGHKFNWEGGSVQRNGIGFRVHDVYQVRIATYCELNTINDVILGKEGGNYDYGIHGAIMDINTTPNTVSDCNIALYHSQDIKIFLGPSNTEIQQVPFVRADGYSKYINVVYETEGIDDQPNPWEFQGNSVESVKLETMNKTKYLHDAAVSEKFMKNGMLYGEFLARFVDYRDSLEYFMHDGHFIISSDSPSAGLKVKDRRSGADVDIFRLLPSHNAVLLKNDYENDDPGKGLVVTTPDGTAKYRITVDDTGAITSTLV